MCERDTWATPYKGSKWDVNEIPQTESFVDEEKTLKMLLMLKHLYKFFFILKRAFNYWVLKDIQDSTKHISFFI